MLWWIRTNYVTGDRGYLNMALGSDEEDWAAPDSIVLVTVQQLNYTNDGQLWYMVPGRTVVNGRSFDSWI